MRAAAPLGVPPRSMSSIWTTRTADPIGLRRLALLLVATAAVVACGSASATLGPPPATPSPPPAMTVDRAASGSTVTLAPGQQLVVTLETNPSTGFSWVSGVAPDPSVLAQLGEPGYTPSAESGRIGVGGIATLTYVAVAVGETGFSLLYQQPWENATVDRFELSVIVR